MDPISALRTHLNSWLDDAPTPAPADKTPAPTDFDLDRLPVIDRKWDDVVRNMSKLDTTQAEPEPAAPVVVGTPRTASAQEVPLTRTDPSTREVIRALQKAWPGLSEVGARTLAAQHLLETGGGSACWNWNLGNMKASANEPHVYLANVWEVCPPSQAGKLVDASKGLARVATDEEVAANHWSCPLGQQVVVFQPPHAQTRFRSYSSLAAGAAGWVGYYQGRVTKAVPDIVAKLNAGDARAVAHALATAQYYSGGEKDYAAGLARKLASISRNLGALP